MARSTFRHMRPASKAGSLAVVAIVMIIVAAASNPPIEIDFRLVHATAPALRIVGGGSGGGEIGGTGKVVAPPLSVSLADTELGACAIAQRYSSVRLLNNGSKQLLLPWTPDGAKIIPADRSEGQLVFESLSVTIRSKEKSGVFVTKELYGLSSIPTSLAAVPPGQSAVLRNIALPQIQGTLCGPDIVAEISLTSHRVVRSPEGYLLTSQEQWRVKSN